MGETLEALAYGFGKTFDLVFVPSSLIRETHPSLKLIQSSVKKVIGYSIVTGIEIARLGSYYCLLTLYNNPTP